MHHSRARGGKPRQEQSRATAWWVTRWADALQPKVILVENVREFVEWGPLGADGKLLKSRKSEVLKSWVATLESLGYRVDFRELLGHLQAIRWNHKQLYDFRQKHRPLDEAA